VPATASIDAVVFDVGGVLLDWDPRYLYRKLFDDHDAMERFLAEVCTLEWHAHHDRGTPVEQSCAALAEAHPEHSELIWAWGRRSEEMIAGPIEGTVELVGELRQLGVRCYLLTNMEAHAWPQRLARFPFLGWFDGAVVSAFEGVCKPEREIFERLLIRFALEPSRAVLVDDQPANVGSARACGMQAVLFESPRQLRGWLEDAGLLAAR
jgi:2-haloacid dehalogenase